MFEIEHMVNNITSIVSGFERGVEYVFFGKETNQHTCFLSNKTQQCYLTYAGLMQMKQTRRDRQVSGFFYIVDFNNGIYKVGKTELKSVKYRTKAYGVGCKLVYQARVADCHWIETQLIKLCRTRFKQVPGGLETFNASEEEIVLVCDTFVKKHVYSVHTNFQTKDKFIGWVEYIEAQMSENK